MRRVQARCTVSPPTLQKAAVSAAFLFGVRSATLLAPLALHRRLGAHVGLEQPPEGPVLNRWLGEIRGYPEVASLYSGMDLQRNF